MKPTDSLWLTTFNTETILQISGLTFKLDYNVVQASAVHPWVLSLQGLRCRLAERFESYETLNLIENMTDLFIAISKDQT